MGLRTSTAALAIMAALPVPALAQEESGDAPPPVATETLQAREVYTPGDFARFAQGSYERGFDAGFARGRNAQ